MGICISSASEEKIPEVNYGHDNVVYYHDDHDVHHDHEVKRAGSLFSQQGSKGQNQDSAILYQGYGLKDGAFGGVFDGHGNNGHVISKFVRNRLPSLILNQQNSLTKYKTFSDGNDFVSNKWEEACVGAFKVMDKEIKLLENLDCSCSGTTSVVVIKQGEDLVLANLGDSRAVLGTIAENGIVPVQLTTDLKPSVPNEAERIRNCNGRVLALKEEPHIQRVWLPHTDSPGLAMSRAFGDFLLKPHGVINIPDISYHRLTSKDQFLVLASDGVWDVLSNNEVASIVWGAESEELAAQSVVEAATAAWQRRFPSSKRDDSSVICMFFKTTQPRDMYIAPKHLDS